MRRGVIRSSFELIRSLKELIKIVINDDPRELVARMREDYDRMPHEDYDRNDLT